MHILHFRVLTTKNRATVVNARVTRGHTVLITGIGGGVALLALKLCLALGARVYVTSSSDAKIARAVALGAASGVNYTHSQYEFSPLAGFPTCMHNDILHF
jgi:NADPH:quinone reductase-like Zn-dependent oxidoreductase